MVYHHKPKCPMEILGCCAQGLCKHSKLLLLFGLYLLNHWTFVFYCKQTCIVVYHKAECHEKQLGCYLEVVKFSVTVRAILIKILLSVISAELWVWPLSYETLMVHHHKTEYFVKRLLCCGQSFSVIVKGSKRYWMFVL